MSGRPLREQAIELLRLLQIQSPASRLGAYQATKFAVCGEGGSRYAAEPSSKYAAFFGQNAAQKPDAM